MKDKKLILGVTGIRSEYDIMSSVFHAIHFHPNLELRVAATGAHLSAAYGNTIDQIYKDGFTVADEIDSLLNSDKVSSRIKGLGIQLQGLVQTVIREKPDILLVLGDGEEAMTTALVGSYMNIPVAHICGGDRVVGNVDDQVRHAVTKLSHLHFVTNSESEGRIIRLGEEPNRIFNVGNPGLDRLINMPTMSVAELSESLDFLLMEDEPFIMLIQHVISSEVHLAYEQMKTSLEAIKEFGIKTIISYPNSDAGSQKIIEAIKEYEALPFIHVAKNIPRIEFVNLLRRTSCLMGNSSAGILEAPLLKLPVINIGNRQSGRLHAENVQFIPHDKESIISAMNKAVYDISYRKFVQNCKNPYGDGNSSTKIANILHQTTIDSRLLIKDITY